MITKFKIAAGAAVAFAALASTSAHAADATADARAQILTAVNVSVAAGSVLDFGKVAADANGGTVVLAAATGARTCTGVTCVGTSSAVTFNITGETGETVGVTIPTGNITLTHTAGAGTGTMTLSSLTNTTSGNAVVLAAGANPFSVGGTITLGANQASGVYNGQFTVSVDYQ